MEVCQKSKNFKIYLFDIFRLSLWRIVQNKQMYDNDLESCSEAGDNVEKGCLTYMEDNNDCKGENIAI